MAVNLHRVLAVLLIVSLLLIAGVSAANDKDKSLRKISKHSYKHIEVQGIVETILGLLGVERNYYEVEVNDMVVAELPEDSVLLNVTIHDDCLPHQYGTDKWLKCEGPLQ